RAFGALRTDVFKASALRGVKSLFPAAHNPYHACFSTKESVSVPFARFGFPEGRVFFVNDKGEIRNSVSRMVVLSFPRLNELVHEIFPFVSDSQGRQTTQQRLLPHGPAALSSPAPVYAAEGARDAPADATRPATQPRIPPGSTGGPSRVSSPLTLSGRGSTALEDTYNDFNFWKITPAPLEDDY
ncbi:hypothetical protein B484DRAFT_398296, partial [Ochromonadaceae sp. CCMP2298]